MALRQPPFTLYTLHFNLFASPIERTRIIAYVVTATLRIWPARPFGPGGLLRCRVPENSDKLRTDGGRNLRPARPVGPCRFSGDPALPGIHLGGPARTPPSLFGGLGWLWPAGTVSAVGYRPSLSDRR